MGIFNKPLLQRRSRRQDLPEGLWIKCPECGAMIHTLELQQNLQVCQECGYHFLIAARERIELLADPGTFAETDAGLVSANPLGFAGYAEKTADLRAKTGLDDAVVTGRLAIGGQPAMIAVMDFKYFAGSMGSVVGEKITRAVETA
nr:acetyl-CoA carboxylase carboxyl transferase subunit beta [Akkermansiaceae bacterium]